MIFSWINLFCIIGGLWEFNFGWVMLALIADEIIIFGLLHSKN